MYNFSGWLVRTLHRGKRRNCLRCTDIVQKIVRNGHEIDSAEACLSILHYKITWPGEAGRERGADHIRRQTEE